MNDILLEVNKLKKYFPIHTGLFKRHTNDVKAVDDVSFTLKRGETMGLVGESGCGKSTLGRSIIRLYEPSSGTIRFNGSCFNSLKGSGLRTCRRDIQMVFQDPFAALDPRMTVGQILMEPFKVHNIGNKEEREEKAKELLKVVGLKDSHALRYPHEFSGGQRQRISIARAIALRPKLIVADEPVSALDVSIQAQILNLMKELQQDLGLTYLFISHDLAVVEYMCDFIAVMYLGKIVEIASKDDLYAKKAHPYTEALIAAVPKVGEGRRFQRTSLKGEVPSPINPPKGCSFHPRCPKAKDICAKEIPPLKSLNGSDSGPKDHKVACWLY